MRGLFDACCNFLISVSELFTKLTDGNILKSVIISIAILLLYLIIRTYPQ